MGNFKTTLFNIQNKVEANRILNSIKTENPELNVNFNFNETEIARQRLHLKNNSNERILGRSF
jgi:hypothetical protein